MKKQLFILLFALVSVGSTLSTFAQVATNYTYSESSGSATYTDLTTGTVVGTSAVVNFNSIPALSTYTLPSPSYFYFNNLAVSKIYVSDNGFITLGTASSTAANSAPGATTSAPISDATAYSAANYIGAIAGFATNLGSNTTSAGEVKYDLIGSSPNRVFVVQYKNMQRYNGLYLNGLINMQIRFYETTGVIEVLFRDAFSSTSFTSIGGQVGLKGLTNTFATDILNRKTPVTNIWPSSDAGTANNSTLLTQGVSPGPGAVTGFKALSQLVWTPCFSPTAITAVAQADLTTVDIGWTQPAIIPATGYDWKITTDAAGLTILASETGVFGSTVSYTGLAAGVDYYIWVKSNCKNVWSSYAANPFTIPCVNKTIPYIQNFESSVVPAIPSCNSTVMVSGANFVTVNNASTAYYGFNSKNLITSGNLAQDIWFFTQAINVTAADLLVSGGYFKLSYKYGSSREQAFFQQKMKVAYGTVASVAGMTTILADHSDIKESPLTNVINFNITAPGTYYIGFNGYANASQGNLQLDDISLDYTTCFEPTQLTSSQITSNSARVSWTAPGIAPSEGYQYYYATLNTPPLGTSAPNGSTAAGGVVTNLANLTPLTTYYFWVRSSCGGNDFSNWSSMGTFTTTAAIAYCTPLPTSVDASGITNVTFGSINNTTGAEAGRYGNYSNLSTNVAQGATVTVSITLNTSIFNYNTRIWIDWNNDGDFYDAIDLNADSDTLDPGENEMTAYGLSSTTSPNTLQLSFYVPTLDSNLNSTLGPHRVRIGAADVNLLTGTNAGQGPCYTGSFGTFEDYSIYVITLPPVLTLSDGTLGSSSKTICSGNDTSATPVTVSSVHSDYQVYIWSPAAGVSGSLASGYVFNPTTTTTYVLTATQTSGNFSSNSASYTVYVNQMPTPIIITPTTTTTCQTAPSGQALSATGGISSGVVIVSEDFNSATNIFTTVNNSTGGNPSLAAWSLQPSPYYSISLFNSNDNSQFYLSDSNKQGTLGTTNTELISPEFSLTGYVDATLSFWHYYRGYATGTALVQISTDGGATYATLPNASWTTVSQGVANNFANVVVNLSAYVGQNNLKLKFKYANAVYAWYWAIDNVVVSGTNSSAVSWSPTTGLYVDSALTTAYTGSATSNVYARPSATTTYTASVLSPGGCSTATTVTNTVTVTPLPTANAQTLPSASTVANLVATGNDLKWYAGATGGSVLIATTTLFTGTYYVSQIISGCESLRKAVSVTISPSLYTAIPDENFEQALIDMSYDDVIDGQVLTANISSVTQLDVEGNNIMDLTGIRAFTSLKRLFCGNNSFNHLNLTGLTQLEWLTCENNESLSQFITTGLTNMKNLSLSNTYVDYLDLSGFPNLEILDCSNTGRAELDVSGMTKLKELHCYYNALETLTVEGLQFLTTINCSGNMLTSCSFTNLPSLTFLDASGNQLETLDLSSLNALYYLDFSYNQLSTVNVLNLHSLGYLLCHYNALTSLNIGGLTSLFYLYCSGNSFPSLSLNGFTSSLGFTCYDSPYLTCIQVDNVAAANSYSNWDKDSSVNYSTACPGLLQYTAIPDANFEQALIDLGYDTLIDGQVLTASISGIIDLDVSGNSITDLTGIEDFTNLQVLDCSFNQIMILDLVGLSNLQSLNCSGNQLMTLEVSTLTNLETLDFSYNMITTVDVNSLINLSQLQCSGNELTALVLDNLVNLWYLDFSFNQISTVDLSNLIVLDYLICHYNALTNLNITGLTSIGYLYCSGNAFSNLNLSGFNSSLGFTCHDSPNLTCIQVDDVATANSYTNWNKDNNVSYSTTCVLPPPPSAVAQVFCNNATITDLMATGIDLKWYTASSGGLALTSSTALTTGNYYVSQTVDGLESTRTLVSVTVNVTPMPMASDQSFCFSAKVLNLTATGTTIKWYSLSTGGVPLTSATVLTTATTYYVTQTLNNCESPRKAVVITIYPKSVAGTISGAGTICTGSAKVLTLSANHVGAEQWQSSSTLTGPFSDIIGETDITLNTGNLSATTYFRAVVTSGVCTSATTATATVTVSPTAIAGTIQGGGVTVCKTLNSTTMQLTGYSGVTFAWQKSTTIDGVYANIAGATLDSYVTPSLSATTFYRVIVSNGACSDSTSPVAISVNPASVAGAISGAGTICYGSNKILTLSASHVGTVQWQSSTALAGPFSDIIGETDTTLNTGILSATTYFRAVVTSGVCPSAITSVIAVTVTPQSVSGNIVGGGGTVCPGTNSTLLTLSGYTGKIQWQYSTDNNNFISISTGGTLANYTAKNLTTTTYYRAMVTSGTATCTPAFSASIAINVSLPVIAGAVSGNTVVCYGTVTTVTVSGNEAGSSIQWQKSSSLTSNYATIAGATSASYTTSGLTSNTFYRALITHNGCSSATAGFGIIVQKAVAGTITGGTIAPATACLGTPSVLTLVGYTGATIQWQYSSTTTSASFTNISGATTSTYTAPNAISGTTYYKASVAYPGCKAVLTPVINVTVAPCVVAKTVAEVFEVVSYPNPFATTFLLEMNTTGKELVQIKVYDMQGKLIEHYEIKPMDLPYQELGGRYATGIYNVVITQGENLKTLRIIKK
jgi:hypothetical protein